MLDVSGQYTPAVKTEDVKSDPTFPETLGDTGLC